MKYIDANKLKAEIERRMSKHWEGLPDADSPEDDWTHNELCELGAYKELEYIEDFLNSLQQEKQMPDSTQLIEEWENTKSMLEGKDFRNDSWRLAYNAFLEGFAVGCVRKEQKPTEWSEEDKHRCDDAIYFLETAKKHYADTSEIELTIKWLKSLQPQSKDEIHKEKNEKPKHTEVWVEGRTIFEQDAKDYTENWMDSKIKRNNI